MGSSLSCRRSASTSIHSPSATADFLDVLGDTENSSPLLVHLEELAMAELDRSQRARYEERRHARRFAREAASAETMFFSSESNSSPPASEKAIRRLPRISASALDEESQTCGVCCETYQAKDVVTKLPCGHSFHMPCVEHWLKRHCTCPMCRFELTTNDSNIGQERQK